MSEIRKTIHSEDAATSSARGGRGAPPGNRNAFKTGRYSKEILDKLKLVRGFTRGIKVVLLDVDEEVKQKLAIRKRRRKLGPRKKVLKP